MRRFDVLPITVRDEGWRGKGYKRGADDKRRPDGEQRPSPLEDAFSRYLPPCAAVTSYQQGQTGDVTENAAVTCTRCHVCKSRDKQGQTGHVTCHGLDPPKETENTNTSEGDDAALF